MATATGDIRNLALLGHAGAGKTLLAEALLFGAGAIRAKGSLARGTTVCGNTSRASSAISGPKYRGETCVRASSRTPASRASSAA